MNIGNVGSAGNAWATQMQRGGPPPGARMQAGMQAGQGAQGAQSMEELFAQIDSDGDGNITQGEFEAFKPTESSDSSSAASSFNVERSTSDFAAQRGGGPGGMHGPGGPPPGPPPGDMGSSDPLASLDSDEDGAISAEEFGLEGATAQLQQLFDAIDGDEDGSLSTAELKSFHEQMQALQVQHYAQVAANGTTAAAAVVGTAA
ncbi:MAG: hypothetical protein IPG57_09165 [Burkholderiales bacterium]|jgi:Ca2+-binding EF-hand superfamily protein|nr:hypothetical protein [Burkholderiales bacterium]MBP7520399.1 hypothetical protein [Leptothrix sp. (in: b-proteobacteria)]